MSTLTAAASRAVALTTAERTALSESAAEALSLGDVTAVLDASCPEVEAFIWTTAAALTEALPVRLRGALDDLAAGTVEFIRVDGEPERERLPPTLAGLSREQNLGLMTDWLSLAYAWKLGTRRIDDVGVDQVRLEWQLGDDALHVDGLQAPSATAATPNSWKPRSPASTYSSLRCVRVGSNPNLRTVFARVNSWVRQSFGAGQLHQLALRQFSCPLIQTSDGRRWPFSILARDEDGRWSITAEALESSLFNAPKSAGAGLGNRTGPAATSAVAAFDRARKAVGRCPIGVRWRPGRRFVLRQAGFLHGRSGGVHVGCESSWDSERWMSRFNANPTPSVRCRSRAPTLAATAEQFSAEVSAARRRQRRTRHDEASDVLRALSCFEW